MKIMGHRGARDKALENTIKSFQFLIESNIPIVEFDIHSSKDNIWIVHHDTTIDRITTSSGKIAEMTLNELKVVRSPEGDPIPTLEEVLKLFSQTEIGLQIEIKSSGDWDNLKKQIENYPRPDLITIISFNHRLLFHMKSLMPQIKTTCLLEGLPMNPVEIIKACKADGISVSIRTVDKELVEEVHRANLTVTTWNANDRETLIKMQEMGVDFVGTDKPYSAIEWIK